MFDHFRCLVLEDFYKVTQRIRMEYQVIFQKRILYEEHILT